MNPIDQDRIIEMAWEDRTPLRPFCFSLRLPRLCDCFDAKITQAQQFQPLAEKGQQWGESKTLAGAQPRNRPIQVHASTEDYTQ